MKKKSIWMLVMFLSLLLLCFMLNPWNLFRYAGITRYYVEFDACAEELKILVQYLQSNHCGSSYLSVTLDNSLYCPEHGSMDVPDEIQNAVSIIRQQGFVCKDAQWDTIRFPDGRIQLDIVNGQYALIYSPDGRPKYLHSPEEDCCILVRQIEGDWYHVSHLP